MRCVIIQSLLCGTYAWMPAAVVAADPPDLQYEHGSIRVAAATAEEPLREAVDVKLAAKYLEEGTRAWSESRGCVSCHTNGTYLSVRPALTPWLGPPAESERAFFVEQLHELQQQPREKLRQGITPTQIGYVAAGLAAWDAHLTKTCSAETDAALRLMYEVQSPDGSLHNTDCWPPLESSSYHGATVAAMATAIAPGWIQQADQAGRAGYARLKTYLQSTEPPHDYARVLLLWAAAHTPDLVDEGQRQALISQLWKHQRGDGGWSLRTFAAPEAWGRGNRAKKLRGETEFQDPPSDGHMTGLAVIVLRDAGVPASDARIQRAITWLKSNQRESGRWWTRSLNTDRFHFITYSGTCYPLLALAKCDALPPAEP